MMDASSYAGSPRVVSREPQAIRGDIEFEHVAFAYTADAPVLKDVNFKIKAGQLVGVVGPTGGGKSTIVSLIPRFYDPSAGVVKIDDVDIREFKFHAMRDQIGYVLQETVLFEGTVRDFLRRANPWAERAMIERLLEAAERGLWEHPDAATLDRLRSQCGANDAWLESRGE